MKILNSRLQRTYNYIVDSQNWQTGQTDMEDIVKSPIGLHYCVDLVKTIEMHI